MMLSAELANSASSDVLTASPSKRLCGEIEVPGDKSISHRALILGALARGTTEIRGLLASQDVLRTVAALRAFGVDLREEAGTWLVQGGEWRTPDRPIDCGNSGTSARLLLGAMAPFALEAVFTGDDSLRRRPMDRILQPLTRMGLKADPRKARTLPVTVRGGRLEGIAHRSPVASAQVKSAVLLAGLRARGEVQVLEPTPSRDHTERMLRQFGCDVGRTSHEGRSLVYLGLSRRLSARTVEVPGDPSAAAFPLVAALITEGSRVTVRNMMVNPLRLGLLHTLGEMGAEIRVDNYRQLGAEHVADVTASHSRLAAVRVPSSRAASMIDEYPILAVAAAFAGGTSRFEGVGELRHKESDRLASISAGLAACGVRCSLAGDDLLVEGNGGPVAGGACVRSLADHRIAMAFLVLGLASKSGVQVDDSGMIGTSFPGFAPLMQSLGATIG